MDLSIDSLLGWLIDWLTELKKLWIAFRLRDVLAKDTEEEQRDYAEYTNTTPSELEIMQRRTKSLRNKRAQEEKEFVQKQYQRQWK